MDTPDAQPVGNERDQSVKSSIKLLTDDKEMLVRAIDKWIKFNQGIWAQINNKLEVEIRRAGIFSIWMRVAIIIISAAITTMSSINGIPRVIITVIAGILTALTGVEAFLKLGERQSNARKMQREIEHLRDDLRFKWFNEVEVPDYAADFPKRLDAARKLLEDGPEQYNQILDKYAMKAEKGVAPGEQGSTTG